MKCQVCQTNEATVVTGATDASAETIRCDRCASSTCGEQYPLPPVFLRTMPAQGYYVIDPLSTPVELIAGPFETIAEAERDRREYNCADDYQVVISPPTVRTEDGATLVEGDRAFDYYGMKAGVIDTAPDDTGWFRFLHDDGTRDLLNGDRICSTAFAARKGWVK